MWGRHGTAGNDAVQLGQDVDEAQSIARARLQAPIQQPPPDWLAIDGNVWLQLADLRACCPPLANFNIMCSHSEWRM